MPAAPGSAQAYKLRPAVFLFVDLLFLSPPWTFGVLPAAVTVRLFPSHRAHPGRRYFVCDGRANGDISRQSSQRHTGSGRPTRRASTAFTPTR